MVLIDLKVQVRKQPKSILRWIRVDQSISLQEFIMLLKKNFGIKNKITGLEYKDDPEEDIKTRVSNQNQFSYCMQNIQPDSKIELILSEEVEEIKKEEEKNLNEIDEKNVKILMDRFPNLEKREIFELYIKNNRNLNAVLNHFSSGTIMSNKSEEDTLIDKAYSQNNKEKEDIYLIFDTNVFAATQIEKIRRLVEHPRITLIVPYVVFQELDDFKDAKQKESEGDTKRFIGRNSFKLIDDYLNTGKVKIGKQSEQIIWNIGSTKLKKDDYLMFSIKYYEEKSGKKVVVVSKDKGVSLRIRSQCPNVFIYDNLLDVYRFMIDN